MVVSKAEILSTLPLVDKIASPISIKFARVPFEDIRHMGVLGLLDAASRYDPDRGTKFSSFAYPRIFGSIINEMRKEDRLTEYQRTKRNRAVRQAYREEVIYGETSLETQVLLDSMPEIMHCGPNVDGVEDKGSPGPEKRCQTRVDFELVLGIMDRVLSSSEKEAIEKYYSKETNMREVAKEMGVSKTWVQKLLGSGVEKIRKELGCGVT